MGALIRRPLFQGCVGIFGACLAIVAIVLALVPPKPTPLETIMNKQGEPLQKAPQSEFDREVTRSAENLKKIATEYFDAAENDFEAQDYKSAAENYAKSTATVPTMSAYLDLGLVCINLSDRTNAEVALQKGLQMSRDEQNKTFEVGFLNNLGLVYLDEGKPQLAADTLQQALMAAQQTKSLSGQAFALTYLGKLHERQAKYDDAISNLQDAINISINPSLVYVHLRALELLGVSHLGRSGPGDIDSALQIFQEQVCPISKQLGFLLGQASCLNNVGEISRRHGNYADAMRSFRSAYDLYKKEGSSDGQAASLNLTAEAFIAQRKFPEALTASIQAHQLYVGTNEIYGQALSLEKMANAYWGEHNRPEALQSLQRALPLAEQAENSALKSRILQEMDSIKRNESAATRKVVRNSPHTA